jgi:hypothetical protein
VNEFLHGVGISSAETHSLNVVCLFVLFVFLNPRLPLEEFGFEKNNNNKCKLVLHQA